MWCIRKAPERRTLIEERIRLFLFGGIPGLGFGRDEQAHSFHQEPEANEAKESQHSNDARVRKPIIEPITDSAEGWDGSKRSADADVFYSFEANRPHSLPEEILHEFGGLSAAETLAEQIGRHLQGRIAPQHFR